MQLCADSIRNGNSRDIFSENSGQGNVSSLLQYFEQDPEGPHVQSWKRMTDPVVLHDPFSSLLGLVLCLTLQLPSGDGPFTSLVLLFYLICFIQILPYAGAAIIPHLEAVPSVSSFIAAVKKSLHGKMYNKATCLRCNTVPDRPALCLFCDTLWCDFSPHSSCGCRQSECYKHALACGAGVGVFLLLQRINILLQCCERRSALPSPYLDATERRIMIHVKNDTQP